MVVLTALLLLAACDLAGPAEAVAPQYVVEAYLVAGAPLPPVRLSRTTPLDSTYRFNELAVRGAEVFVEALDAEGQVAARYAYAERPDTVGVYLPVGAARLARVEPLVRYRLQVVIDEGALGPARLEAVTRVPGAFHVVDVSTQDVVYGQAEQIAASVTQSRYPGRAQAYYVLTAETLRDTLRREALTPFYAALVEDVEDVNLYELRITSSPVLNEANYEEQADGTLRIQVPWIAIAFYGRNRLSVNAVDDNLYDYLRSQQAQRGGSSTLAPGEIPNIIEHVKGGTGLFGSLARQQLTVTVRREE